MLQQRGRGVLLHMLVSSVRLKHAYLQAHEQCSTDSSQLHTASVGPSTAEWR